MDDFLMHIGTPHEGSVPHSGRYPYGSGDKPFQRYQDFYTSYNRLKAGGYSEKQIAEKLGVVDRWGNPNITKLRAKYSNAKAEKRSIDRATVLRLKEQGLNNSEIGREMGIGESTVRSLLDESRAQRNDLNRQTADVLKKYVDEKRYIDIGPGIEVGLGVTANRVNNAVALLEEDGYKKQFLQIDQMGTNYKTTLTVLTPPDCDYAELSEHRFDIQYPGQDSRMLDPKGDASALGLHDVTSVDSKRILIRYNEEGGLDNDGLIELRRGVDDISLGGSMYAQVRIGVDDKYYMKGMARYTDDIPDGYDIIYNSNKHLGTAPEKVFKAMKVNPSTGEVDWDNPFGASVTQKTYIGEDGKEHISCINMVRDQGELLNKWSDNLASQFYSKQSPVMAERQLKLDYEYKKQEYDEIMALENPTIKKKLLISFADGCDSAASELKAAPFAGQQWAAILPYSKIKDGECYAPWLHDGDKVALVRYPHGGTFEIPILTVHNTGSPAESTIHNAPDAIGINKNTADRLSGADFDGDAVVVIPLSDKVRVRSTPVPPGLIGYDPREEYPKYEGMKVMSERDKQMEMGKVTNLIADMTLKGASPEDIALATRHSMTVIDAVKHELDWKRSEKENQIERLKKTYQADENGNTGASTIISRASSQADVNARKDWYPSTKSIDPVTGKKIYKETGETYTVGKLKGVTIKDGGEVIVNTDKKTGQMYYLKADDNGKKVRVPVTEDDFTRLTQKVRTQKTTKMAVTDDAYTLTSGGSRENPGYRMEKVCAEYANSMKALANEARKSWLETPPLKYNKEANLKYKDAVQSLDAKLKIAEAHSPLERQAQLQANRVMAIKKQDNPGLTKDEIKKYKGQAIVAARNKFGKKERIEISDYEAEAIKAGAISDSKLQRILTHADTDSIRAKFTPRATKNITPTMTAMAKSMESAGYTTAQIADRLGISTSSVSNIVNG